MNVVSIMAHQDDEMRCLGTMLKCRARGDRLFFVTVTDGSKGFVQRPDISREEAARIRHDEMSELAERVGGEYWSLGEPDEFLYDTPDVRMMLIETIRKTSADLIFTHYTVDYNRDHTTVTSLVQHCAMQSCLPLLPTRTPPLEKHPAIFMVEPFGAVKFPASYYVDISDYEDEKVELLKCHASQDEAMTQALGTGMEKLCEGIGSYRGEQVNVAYAECFVPMEGRGTIKPYPVLP